MTLGVAGDAVGTVLGVRGMRFGLHYYMNWYHSGIDTQKVQQRRSGADNPERITRDEWLFSIDNIID